MAEPTLSEITNIRVDPEVGSGTPANVIAASDVVRTLNENAKFKAVNDMNKYKMFTEQLSNVFQNGIDIANTEVRAEDKDRLVKGLAEVLDPISKDPHALFSRQGMTDTYGKLIKLKSDATKSKQANTFTQTSREFINLNPSFRTDNNVNLVKQSEVAPLETWKPFQFDYDPPFDISAVSKLFGNDPSVVTKFSRFSDNNEFIESGTKRDKNSYLKKWETLLLDPKVRKSIKSQYYDQLSDSMKKVYTTPDGQPDITTFGLHLADGSFGNSGEIVEKMVANPFALSSKNANEKLRLSREKHGQDIDLLQRRFAGEGDLIALRNYWKGRTATKNAQGKIVESNKVPLGSQVEYLITSSEKPENAVYGVADASGNREIIGYRIPMTEASKQLFGHEEEIPDSKGKMKRVPPSEIVWNPNTKKITTKYYEDKKNSFGVEFPDKKYKSEDFTPTEFTARVSKSLGLKNQEVPYAEITSGKNVASQQQNKGDKLPVDANGQTDPSLLVKGKVYEVSGKKYKWDGKNLNEL